MPTLLAPKFGTCRYLKTIYAIRGNERRKARLSDFAPYLGAAFNHASNFASFTAGTCAE